MEKSVCYIVPISNKKKMVMMRRFKHFILTFLGGFALIHLVHAQDQSGIYANLNLGISVLHGFGYS